MKLTRLFVLLLSAFTLGFSFSACQEAVSESLVISIAAGDLSTVPVNLDKGDRISGVFRLLGEPETDMGFAIRTPEGRFVPRWDYDWSHTFNYEADSNGVHLLYFDNTSSNTPKRIHLSYSYPKR